MNALARLAWGAAALALALVAVACAWQWWAGGALGGVVAGERCAVTLVSGPVFYGVVQEARRGSLQLSDVYYVQTVQRADGQRDNKLVNRRRNDWHSPESMIIPLERIALVERMGARSEVSRLIEQDQKAQAEAR